MPKVRISTNQVFSVVLRKKVGIISQIIWPYLPLQIIIITVSYAEIHTLFEWTVISLLALTSGNPIYLISTNGARRMWPVRRGCLLLHDIYIFIFVCLPLFLSSSVCFSLFICLCLPVCLFRLNVSPVYLSLTLSHTIFLSFCVSLPSDISTKQITSVKQ